MVESWDTSIIKFIRVLTDTYRYIQSHCKKNNTITIFWVNLLMCSGGLNINWARIQNNLVVNVFWVSFETIPVITFVSIQAKNAHLRIIIGRQSLIKISKTRLSAELQGIGRSSSSLLSEELSLKLTNE